MLIMGESTKYTVCWRACSTHQCMRETRASWLGYTHSFCSCESTYVPLKPIHRSTCPHDKLSMHLACVPWELHVTESKCNSEHRRCWSNFIYRHQCPYRLWSWLWDTDLSAGHTRAVLWLFAHLFVLLPFGARMKTLNFPFQNIGFLTFMFMVSWK